MKLTAKQRQVLEKMRDGKFTLEDYGNLKWVTRYALFRRELVSSSGGLAYLTDKGRAALQKSSPHG